MYLKYTKTKSSGSYNYRGWVDILCCTLRKDGQNVCITKMMTMPSLTRKIIIESNYSMYVVWGTCESGEACQSMLNMLLYHTCSQSVQTVYQHGNTDNRSNARRGKNCSP